MFDNPFLTYKPSVYIWVFPKIMVPPKSSILIGFSIIFTIHFGVFPPIFNFHTHLFMGSMYLKVNSNIYIYTWNSKQPFINRCWVISNHFLCKDWVHHPIETTIFFKWMSIRFQVYLYTVSWIQWQK